MGGARRRLWALVEDELLDRLQLGDCARYLLLAGRQLVDAARYLLLTCGDAGGDPVDALPHRVEIERYGIELLVIGSRRGHLSSRPAIGLPGHSGSDADEKR